MEKSEKKFNKNFPIQTSETAYLFLQHFMRMLKAGGRGAIVIKNTFLSNSDNASVALRKELLETCNLHTILDCPSGTFLGAGVKTVVLFFERELQRRTSGTTNSTQDETWVRQIRLTTRTWQNSSNYRRHLEKAINLGLSIPRKLILRITIYPSRIQMRKKKHHCQSY